MTHSPPTSLTVEISHLTAYDCCTVLRELPLKIVRHWDMTKAICRPLYCHRQKKTTNQMMTGTGAAFEDNDWSPVQCRKSVLPSCLGLPSGCHEQPGANDVIAVWRWHYAAHLTAPSLFIPKNLGDFSFPCMKVALLTLGTMCVNMRVTNYALISC